MSDWKLGAVESRFADLIWQGEPMTSTQLVRQAEEALGWKKSTTYTVLKRLCQRGIFQNQDGVVTALVSKEEVSARLPHCLHPPEKTVPGGDHAVTAAH